MRTPLLAAAVAAALAFSGTGNAAPAKPQITDASGDQIPVGGAGYDIVSGLFKTEGTTSKVGRKTVYTPTKLVVTVTYAGAVPADAYASQAVVFDAPGCENIYLQAYEGGSWGFADCLGDGSFEPSVKKSGSTVTFAVPFGLVGKSYLKPGASLVNLRAYTSVGDPVLGYESGQVHDLTVVDNATTTASYKIA